MSFWAAVGRLSRPYQLFALVYVGVIFRTETAWVTWAADRIHVSFGLVRLWPDSYRGRLQAHLLSERLLMTVVSVALVALAMLLHALSARLSPDGRSAIRLWSESRGASAVVLAAMVVATAYNAKVALEASPLPPALVTAAVDGSVIGGTGAKLAIWRVLLHAGTSFARSSASVFPACVCGTFVLALLRGRRSDVKLHLVLLGFALAVAKCIYCGCWDPFAECLWALLLLLWSNHQGEFVPVPSSPLLKVFAASASAALARAAVDSLVFGAMIGAHVVELVLVWLGSVMLAMWLPPAVALNNIAATFGLSFGVAALLYASDHSWLVCLKANAVLVGTLQVLAFLCAVLRRATSIGFTLHAACFLTAPILTIVIANAPFLDNAVDWYMSQEWVSVGFFSIGVIAQTIVTLLDGSAEDSAQQAFKAATVTAATLLPVSLLEALSRYALIDIPMSAKVATALAVMGLLFEHEATLVLHVRRSLGMSK